jgi:hypothetical protein
MSTLNVDALVGVSSANAITVRGEGSATTSLQQGLCKAWAAVDMPGTPAFKDSFNNGSMTDAAAGRTNLSFVTNMSNTGYSNPSEEADGQAFNCMLQSNTTTGYQVNIYTGSAYADADFVTSVFGDLA